MTEPKNRLTSLARITLVRHAAGYVGSEALADAMGIGARALRAKLGADRGITDTDLTSSAAAVETRAHEMLRLVATIRRQVA